jgi:hypothetical protein
VVHETNEILRVDVYFYKELFKKESRGSFSLEAGFWDMEDMVPPNSSEELEAPFRMEEIKAAIFSYYPKGSPGPDGLPFLFYQKHWEVVKQDIYDMFQEFHAGNLGLFRLNFAMLTLIPKTEDAMDMRNYRPISLLNCSFKMFSKLITLRLEKVCQKLIAREQSAFIRGRFILENVVVAHEIVHSVHKTKEPGIIIKLDYEKAYDRVNIDFLLEIPKARGLGDKWIGWIRNIVIGGSVSVLVNGEESPTFKTVKGLRQGEPLSPLLFNIVTNALTKMLAKTSSAGFVKGLLQYADDTLLFSSCEPEAIRNLKGILMIFEQVSGMRVNFHKSKMIPMNLDENRYHEIAHILNFPAGNLPCKYLGVPLHYEKLKREDVQPLVDKLMKRMAGWRGKMLAYSSRLVLIKSCLASVLVYLMSFIKFPKWTIRLLES